MDILSFVNGNLASGGLTQEEADKIKELVSEYHVKELKVDHALISADVGRLGFIHTRWYKDFVPKELKATEGNYDYVDILLKKEAIILWTDYQDIEPYNRQSNLYADGYSFNTLGKPVAEHEMYREFQHEGERRNNLMFGLWAFRYNTFYGSVHLGVCLPEDKVDEFIQKLRVLLNK
jgi:hypothetical protein